MADPKPIAEVAEDSVREVLDAGQSTAQGDVSISRASLRDAHSVLVAEDDRLARRKGRRPLLRGFDLSGMS